jgi:hypothetical protein
MDKGLDDKRYKGCEHPFPWQSTTVGKNMTIGDVCVRGINDTLKSGKPTKTSWDSYSYVLLMAHSLELHIKSVQQANRVFRCDRDGTHNWVPRNLYEFEDAVKEIFTSENPMTEINKHTKLLKEITGKIMGQGVSEYDTFFDSTDYSQDENSSYREERTDEEYNELEQAILNEIEVK